MEREIPADLITITEEFEKQFTFYPSPVNPDYWQCGAGERIWSDYSAVEYLLRMLAGIWFTHNYFYHKPRWRPVVAGVEGRLPGMLKNPFCPGQVVRR